jgi:hypothetical protein
MTLIIGTIEVYLSLMKEVERTSGWELGDLISNFSLLLASCVTLGELLTFLVQSFAGFGSGLFICGTGN